MADDRAGRRILRDIGAAEENIGGSRVDDRAGRIVSVVLDVVDRHGRRLHIEIETRMHREAAAVGDRDGDWNVCRIRHGLHQA